MIATGPVTLSDLAHAGRTLRTGRAHGKDGTITREGQPRRFWRYVYGDYAVFGLCAGILLWLVISLGSFS